MRQDERPVWIERPLQTLYATDQTEALFRNQATLDRSKPGKCSANVQEDG